jgi:hypothetical protein
MHHFFFEGYGHVIQTGKKCRLLHFAWEKQAHSGGSGADTRPLDENDQSDSSECSHEPNFHGFAQKNEETGDNEVTAYSVYERCEKIGRPNVE